MAEEVAIGIDLGTTNCCIAVVRNKVVEIIPNEKNERLVPSMVTFTEQDQLFIGTEALRKSTSLLYHTIYDVKRIIGRNFDDPAMQMFTSNWPFDVIKDPDGNRPLIGITFKNGTKRSFSPEKISALILIELKRIAENYLKRTITKAVVTVPAYFNHNQKLATINAAKLAGLEVLKILPEPTAAAFAYGLRHQLKDESLILIFDLGGGTFDVSIVKIGNKSYEVLATNGDSCLGGADIDTLMYNHIVRYVKSEIGPRVKIEKEQKMRLMAACERAKKELTGSHSAEIALDAFWKRREANACDLNYEFQRTTFENLINDLVTTMINLVRKTLSEAHLTTSQITEIVLVGGSTKILKIHNELNKCFKGIKISKAINPDEAVAYGAAIQAAILVKNEGFDYTVKDINAFSLGVQTDYIYMDKIIEKNSQLPVSMTKFYSTSKDDQRAVRINVYQGDDILVANNMKLGDFDLVDLPKAPKGTLKIEVRFEMDTNGILTVTAQETSTGKSESVNIITTNSTVSTSDMDEMKKELAIFDENRKRQREIDEKKNLFIQYTSKVKKNVDKNPSIIRGPVDDFKKMLRRNESIIEKVTLTDMDKLAEIPVLKSEIESYLLDL